MVKQFDMSYKYCMYFAWEHYDHVRMLLIRTVACYIASHMYIVIKPQM